MKIGNVVEVHNKARISVLRENEVANFYYLNVGSFSTSYMFDIQDFARQGALQVR